MDVQTVICALKLRYPVSQAEAAVHAFPEGKKNLRLRQQSSVIKATTVRELCRGRTNGDLRFEVTLICEREQAVTQRSEERKGGGQGMEGTRRGEKDKGSEGSRSFVPVCQRPARAGAGSGADAGLPRWPSPVAHAPSPAPRPSPRGFYTLLYTHTNHPL